MVVTPPEKPEKNWVQRIRVCISQHTGNGKSSKILDDKSAVIEINNYILEVEYLSGGAYCNTWLCYPLS